MSANIAGAITESLDWANEHRDAARLRKTMHDHGCLIYAAGGYGRQVIAVLRERGYQVMGFVDENAQPGQRVLDLPCRHPDAITPDDAANSVLVIAINNFRMPPNEVVAWAEKLGFAEVVLVPELPDVVAPELGNYWQAARSQLADNAQLIGRVEALLTDNRSRRILDQLVRYRITGRPEHHPEVERERQYFPADLPMASREIAAIDCGAFPGDLAETAHKAGMKLANWYAFEPDPANFATLSAFVDHHPELVGEAVLFPCGVGDQTGSIRFATGNSDASRAVTSNDGDTEVLPVVRVGDVLKLERLDLIKLDIEGFEAAALDGMARLLVEHRPRLALAIYHKPSDLWELPLKVDAMLPGGRYAIRQHGYNGYDTVLYVDWD